MTAEKGKLHGVKRDGEKKRSRTERRKLRQKNKGKQEWLWKRENSP